MTLKYEVLDVKYLDLALDFVYETYLTTIKDEDSELGQIGFYEDYINNDKLKAEFRSGKKQFIACVDVNKIVGVISISDDGFIDYLFINRCYQGLKIGSNLLDRAVYYAKQHKLSHLNLDSSISSINFYLKYGFYKTGEEVLCNEVRSIPMQYDINYDLEYDI